MKILYIGRAGFGAMGEAATYQYASITSRKHDVLVLAPQHPNASEKIVFSDPGVAIADIYSPVGTEQIDNVYQRIRHFRPDIIHMIQSPLCFHYPYYLRHLTFGKWLIDFRSPYVGGKKDPALRRYFYLQFYVDGILTHFMPSLKTNIRLRLRRAYEIPPGVELSLFDRTVQAVSSPSPRNFVFIGSINERRQLEFLVKSFGVFSRQSGSDVILDMYGAGNAVEKMRRCIEENSLNHCVFLRGVLPQQELLKKLTAYDAGIAYVPYEHFTLAPSLKSLEFAAAGIPVLASDTVGHRVYNQQYGFRFKLFANTLEDFCAVMSDIVRQGANTDDIIANQNAVSHFDWQYIVEQKLLPLYEKIVF